MIEKLVGSKDSIALLPARKVRGFTLLEILVALLVLSVGLVGLAGLQTFSLRNNHSAFLRSQATVLAYDALDRIRGNRDQAANYNTTFTASPSAVNCSSLCTSAQIVQHDLAAWKAEVARLPGGLGQITIGANNKATVEVRWVDDRDSSAPLTVAVETLL